MKNKILPIYKFYKETTETHSLIYMLGLNVISY